MTWLSMGLRQFHQAMILPIYKRFHMVQFSTTPRRFNCMVRLVAFSPCLAKDQFHNCALRWYPAAWINWCKLQGSELNDLMFAMRAREGKGHLGPCTWGQLINMRKAGWYSLLPRKLPCHRLQMCDKCSWGLICMPFGVNTSVGLLTNDAQFTTYRPMHPGSSRYIVYSVVWCLQPGKRGMQKCVICNHHLVIKV